MPKMRIQGKRIERRGAQAGSRWRRGAAAALFLLSMVMLGGCLWNPEARSSGEADRFAQDGRPASEPAVPVRGGVIRVLTAEPIEADPLGLSAKAVRPSPYWALAYRGLFRYDERGRWVGDLAQDVRVERGADGAVTVRFRLDGARWSDGQPITDLDVRRTLALYLSPFYTGVFRDHLSALDGASAYRSGKGEDVLGVVTDGDWIVLRATHPTALFFRALTAPLFPHAAVPKIARRADVEALAERIRAGEVPVSGAYRVVVAAEGRLELERASTKAGDAAYADALEFTFGTLGPDDGHAGHEAPVAAYDVVISLKKPALPNDFRLMRVPLPYALYLAADVTRIPDDVRRKLATIDRRPLVAAIEAGEFAARPETGYFPPGHALMEQSDGANAPKGADSRLALGDLAYDRDQPYAALLAPALADVLGTSGYAVSEKPLPHEAFYAETMSGHGAPLFLWPLADVSEPGEWWRYLGKAHTIARLGLNVMHYADDAVDRALKAAYEAIPGEIDAPALREAFRSVAEAAPLIPLLRPEAYVAVAPGMHGVEMVRLGERLNAEQWWKAAP